MLDMRSPGSPTMDAVILEFDKQNANHPYPICARSKWEISQPSPQAVAAMQLEFGRLALAIDRWQSHAPSAEGSEALLEDAADVMRGEPAGLAV